MRSIGIFLIFTLLLGAEEKISKKWESSSNCFPCHTEIVKKWRLSRHANSHFSKNDLFKKTLQYIVKKRPNTILNEIKLKCAQCHNPRVVTKTLSSDDKLSLLMDHSTVQGKYTKALNTKNMQDGVNCVVCHNVDKIHLDIEKGSQGYRSVSFGKQGTMFGPFVDAKSPYHRSEQREHFNGNNPKLCFACHYSAKNYQGLEVYATGKEYEQIQKSELEEEGCKECHMSKKRRGFASNYSLGGKNPKIRMVRVHRFASVDNSNIINDYVDLSTSVEKNKFIIILKNRTPHYLPTGYGLREIHLRAIYYDVNNKVINSKSTILGMQWKDQNGEATIPHLAYALQGDTRLAGKRSKKYYFDIPEKARYVRYILSYRAIGNKLAKKLHIKDNFFLKEYILVEKIYRLQ